MKSIAQLSAELQGYDPQALSASQVNDFLAREIMGSRKIVVGGSDHVVNLRQPERFEELVLPFLADAAP